MKNSKFRRQERRQQNNNGAPTATPKGKKFTGLNKDELQDIVICKTGGIPLAQQFDTLYEALIVYGGSQNGYVKTSLRTMKTLAKKSFEPALPDPSTYKKEDGKTDDEILRKSRMGLWEKECEASNKLFIKYTQALATLFETVMGQLGTEIKNSLQVHAGFGMYIICHVMSG